MRSEGRGARLSALVGALPAHDGAAGGAVEPAELMQALLELAGEACLEVRVAGGDPDVVTASGVCRVRDATWVVLSKTDSVEVQLDVLAAALRSHAAELLEERYLPPAVRERLFQTENDGD